MTDNHAEKTRGLFYYLGVGLSGGLLALIVGLAIAVIVVPAATGSIPLTVLTNSMAPTYPPGTLIIVTPVAPDDIRVGEAITYQIKSGEAGVVTHRVIAVTSVSDGTRTFTTQGDNNGAPDAAQVTEAQLQGKVWYSVPWIGYVNTIVNGTNRGWIVPTIAIGLFLYAGYMVASGIAGAAKKRRLARERAQERELAGANEVLGRTPTDPTDLDEPDPLFRAAPLYKADSL